MKLLAGCPWRGNVRELRNAVERLLVMTPGESVDADDIPVGLGTALGGDDLLGAKGVLAVPFEGLTLQQFKDQAERTFLVARLRANDWNVAATAKAIETPRSNLYKKLEGYGISRERDGS
jgi:two-component system nitrogen regulation response regulator NtrX